MDPTSRRVLSPEVLTATSRRQWRARRLPFVPVCSQTGVGCAGFSTSRFTASPRRRAPLAGGFTPRVRERPIECYPEGPLVAEIVRRPRPLRRRLTSSGLSGTLVAEPAVHCPALHLVSSRRQGHGTTTGREDRRAVLPLGRTLRSLPRPSSPDLARSAGSPARDPTPSSRPTTPVLRPGRARAALRSRSRRAPSPTRTSSPKRSRGSLPRTRASAWRTTARPISW